MRHDLLGEHVERAARPGAFWSGVYYVDDGGIEADPMDPRIIKTVYGAGYVFSASVTWS